MYFVTTVSRHMKGNWIISAKREHSLTLDECTKRQIASRIDSDGRIFPMARPSHCNSRMHIGDTRLNFNNSNVAHRLPHDEFFLSGRKDLWSFDNVHRRAFYPKDSYWRDFEFATVKDFSLTSAITELFFAGEQQRCTQLQCFTCTSTNPQREAAALRCLQDAGAMPAIDWENLGFGICKTDKMYVMKCDRGGEWSAGDLKPFGNLELSPSAGVLNYGQGIFEGLKAHRTSDGRILLFRPEENARRMMVGADRMCMPAPSMDAFVQAVKETVLANERWIPPPGKGSLYVRALLVGSGPILGLAPAPDYTFMIYVAPVGCYFKDGASPINLKIETKCHRAAPGGTGGVKSIGNYASVLKAQLAAKREGFSDVLYLDAVHKKYIEEVSSCNIFVVKEDVISTPETNGTILPGITRKSIVELARRHGYKVEERPVSVDELLNADEVFCTGTAVVISIVGSITYEGKRTSYTDGGLGKVSQKLYESLSGIQMGKIYDMMGWTMQI